MKLELFCLVVLLPIVLSAEVPLYQPQQHQQQQQQQQQQQLQQQDASNQILVQGPSQHKAEKKFGHSLNMGASGGVQDYAMFGPQQGYFYKAGNLGGYYWIPPYKKGDEANSENAKDQQLPNGYFISESTPTAMFTKFFDLTAFGTFFVSGILATFSVYYLCQVFWGPARKSIEDLVDSKPTIAEKISGGKKDVLGVDRTEVETPAESKKSRRKREIKTEAEVTRMASIVLSAIESGECMEHTICLLGRSMSTGKAPHFMNLFEKLLPGSIRQTRYYQTFKKAVKGDDRVCEQFKCRHE